MKEMECLEKLLKCVIEAITIPMYGDIESLNVSIAGRPMYV